jgi:type IV secretion system protein TrbL
VNSAVDSGANSLGEAMMGAWDSIMKGFLTSWLDAGMIVSLEGESMA